jgi:hypothetical protein
VDLGVFSGTKNPCKVGRRQQGNVNIEHLSQPVLTEEAEATTLTDKSTAVPQHQRPRLGLWLTHPDTNSQTGEMELLYQSSHFNDICLSGGRRNIDMEMLPSKTSPFYILFLSHKHFQLGKVQRVKHQSNNIESGFGWLVESRVGAVVILLPTHQKVQRYSWVQTTQILFSPIPLPPLTL